MGDGAHRRMVRMGGWAAWDGGVHMRWCAWGVLALGRVLCLRVDAHGRVDVNTG